MSSSYMCYSCGQVDPRGPATLAQAEGRPARRDEVGDGPVPRLPRVPGELVGGRPAEGPCGAAAGTDGRRPAAGFFGIYIDKL